MNRAFKLRYLFCARVDSQHLLKLLIVFNIFLGIYLLFLSTNYRRYNEHAYNRPGDSVALPLPEVAQQSGSKFEEPKLAEPKIPIANSENGDANSNPKAIQVVAEKNVIPDATFNDNENAVKAIKSNNEQLSVGKIYDSNNKLVVQDSDNGTPDASYKRVEEDDKTLDEIDKLRIEMIDKVGNMNSIIHDSEFSGAEKQPKPNVIKNGGSKSAHLNRIKPNEDLNKDVINRILDHNLHISKNSSKVIIPEAINVESTWWTAETRGKYGVLRDFIQCSLQAEPEMKSITLTTQGTSDFLYHVEQLCDRWEGFISLSVYAPGDDFKLAVNTIYYLRQCGLKCISERVNFHMIYDTLYAPANVTVPAAYLATPNFDCNIPLDESMRLLNINTDFRGSKSLPYPINVLRNVARIASKTKYLFASDIELYPSVGIVPAFFKLLEREQSGQVTLINPKNPHVYVVPIFEVKANKKPPRTKKELTKLFASRDAIFFHRYVCDLCQNFPDRDIWVKQVPEDNSMDVFRVTRRLRERSQWEPLYIGTNEEPFYDERLTWDGKRDKMTQMFEMCLKNYDLLILDNAFLVHAPGIKFYSVKDDTKRLPFIKANQKVHNLLLAQLRHQYGTKNRC